MTNADKIRSMTDRELAEKINLKIIKCVCCPAYHTDLCPVTDMNLKDCADKIEKWLKQEG